MLYIPHDIKLVVFSDVANAVWRLLDGGAIKRSDLKNWLVWESVKILGV